MFPELEELEVEADVEEVPWVLIKAACLRHQQLKKTNKKTQQQQGEKISSKVHTVRFQMKEQHYR